ncbi:MAG TPA: APC family permease [Actinomycetes bacterium]|jgi:amino acid transporter|nr:APC family permease [Actinomycetes bacterium]
MAAVEPARSGELLSERVAGGILPRVLNSFDMVAIFVAIVLFITNAAVIQTAGPTAFGWWILGFLAFLIPSAVVTGQLGMMFPGEGSIYLWTHKAFGAFWGFFAGFCAWWPGVLVMVATGTITLAYLGYVFPGTVGSWSVQVQGLLIIGFVLLSALLAVMRFRVTQNIVNVVFVLYGVAIALMLIAGIVHLAGGSAAEVDPTQISAWAPSRPSGVNFSNWTFFGLVILALLGVEVPLNMGVEIRNVRSITRYLFWGSLAVMAAYLIATWAVMVTVPAAGGQSAQVTAVAEAVRVSLGTFWGDLVALILAGFFLFITVVYNYSFARLIFVSGLDRRLPKVMSHVNSAKVPDVAVVAQTVIAALFALLAFVILPSASGAKPVDVQTRIYDVLQAAVTVIWCISMVVLFIDVLIILRRYAAQFHQRRLAHPVVFWVCSVIGAVAALIGIVSTLSGSWTPLISNDAGTVKLLGAEISYGAWFWWVGGIALASMVVGALLYLLGRRAETSAAQPGPLPAAGPGV